MLKFQCFINGKYVQKIGERLKKSVCYRKIRKNLYIFFKQTYFQRQVWGKDNRREPYSTGWTQIIKILSIKN